MTATATDWRSWPPEAKAQLRDRLQARLVTQMRARWQPYPWQVPPALAADDLMWLLMGGRGTGKTDGAAHYVLDHVSGPPCDHRIPGGHRIAVVAPTIGDAVESCVTGPSGLQAYDPTVQLRSSKGGTYVRFSNGAVGKLFGAHTPDDVNRLRAGGNRCLVWAEELAAWRQLGAPPGEKGADEGAWPHILMGLRIGPRPHLVASTTPKPRPLIRWLANNDQVQVTHGRTRDATHLPQVQKDRLMRLYAGTRLGRQELDGELLGDVEGALWRWAWIDASRVAVPHEQQQARATELAKQLRTVVVALDPAATEKESSDETGIVVVGASDRRHCPVCGPVDEPHGFVLADYSGHYSPGGWARAACNAYHLFGANRIVGEVNNGGDMVGHTVRGHDRTVRYDTVTATRGKMTRAEPVAMLWETEPQRAHLVGTLPLFEDQLTTWVPDEGDSPDRLDAGVWGLTYTLLRRSGGAASVA